LDTLRRLSTGQGGQRFSSRIERVSGQQGEKCCLPCTRAMTVQDVFVSGRLLLSGSFTLTAINHDAPNWSHLFLPSA
jgi:hypothetical protein